MTSHRSGLDPEAAMHLLCDYKLGTQPLWTAGLHDWQVGGGEGRVRLGLQQPSVGWA